MMKFVNKMKKLKHTVVKKKPSIYKHFLTHQPCNKQKEGLRTSVIERMNRRKSSLQAKSQVPSGYGTDINQVDENRKKEIGKLKR